MAVGWAADKRAADLTKLPPAATAKVDYLRDIEPLFKSRCMACHGATKALGGLRLHLPAQILEGGDGGIVLTPGKSAESRLVHYIAGALEGKVMPPAGPRLTAQEVGLVRAWIDQGAELPKREGAAASPASIHWAFQPICKPAVPRVKQAAWVRNPIDAFILARLEAKGLKPAQLADPITQLRRVSLDLTGLPPAPEEVDTFLKDPSPDAFERAVDRLLTSPHYGERWGRQWLDLARYADSNGYSIDGARQMWLYRDWVIQALNADLPFDRFTIEQLAGDLLPNPSREQLIATGFHRNTLVNEEGGTDAEQFRIEAVGDRVDTTGAVWMGLTVGCAKCHTHKYDPLTQREYYQLFAFFNSQDEPNLSFPSPEQSRRLAELKRQLSEAQKALAEYDRLHTIAKGESRKDDPARKLLADRVAALQKDDREFARSVNTAMVLRERPEPRPTHLMIRGDFLRKGPLVRPNVPAVLPPLPPSGTDGHPTRLDLARWLVSEKNPLTPRVTVNRVWMQYFGQGLVETENDFGVQGSLPTHPELLDYLAATFAGVPGSRFPVSGSAVPITGNKQQGTGNREQGTPWSLKGLHRLIVTSATYRQSSKHRPELKAVDPRNLLLAKQNRLRLDAELIRDTALAASGLLSRKIGGPSVFPPHPPGTEALTQVKRVWTPSKGEDRYRRGLYTWHWRSNPFPLFVTFDAPNGNVTCTRRLRSNTPNQALMLANDEMFVEMAQSLGARALREGPSDDAGRIAWMFRRCVGRQPEPGEAARLGQFLRSQFAAFQAEPTEAEKAAPRDRPAGVDAPTGASWSALARVLLNLDEFITRE